MTTPPPATFGVWTELRPAPGRQPDSAYYRQRLDEAVLAEQLGFTAVWGSEHHAVEDAHLSQQFPYLAAVAARTERIRVGTGVLLLPLQRPRDVAEQAGVLDLISDGRLLLGFGAGYVEREFDAFGVARPSAAAYWRRSSPGSAAPSPRGSPLTGRTAPTCRWGRAQPSQAGRPSTSAAAPRGRSTGSPASPTAGSPWPISAGRRQRSSTRCCVRPWSAPAVPPRASRSWLASTCGSATTRNAPGPPSWPRRSPTSSAATTTGPPTATSRALPRSSQPA